MTIESTRIKKQYAVQLGHFQSQIPLSKDSNSVSMATVEHFHILLKELEEKTGEDFSKYQVPNSEIWNPGETYRMDGLRNKLGSVIGYLVASDTDKEKEAGSTEIFGVIAQIKKNLRRLFRDKPTGEKDVQNKLEDIFNVAGFNFRREQVHIPYSSKTYIPDFTFDDISCAVEVKYCNHQNREKELVDEINADVQAYKTKYNNLVFVIYDCGGFIRDSEKFMGDIANNGALVEIIKH